jgi:hypothetical protein
VSRPRKGTLGRLILASGLGFPRSLDLESGSVTIWKPIFRDYNGYPMISRLVGVVVPPADVLSCTQVLRRSLVLRIRSLWPTCRTVGHLVGRAHLLGTSGTLAGGDPWVPMSLKPRSTCRHNNLDGVMTKLDEAG